MERKGIRIWDAWEIYYGSFLADASVDSAGCLPGASGALRSLGYLLECSVLNWRDWHFSPLEKRWSMAAEQSLFC